VRGALRYSCTKAFVIAFCMTFFSVFDVPVFWPILLIYWVMLFFITMKRQIRHMIKHRYLPFSFGKQVAQPTRLYPSAPRLDPAATPWVTPHATMTVVAVVVEQGLSFIALTA
jgi:hypothetical protein